MALNPVTLTQVQSAVAPKETRAAAAPAGSAPAFGEALTGALNNLSQMQSSSDQAMQQLAAGENVDLHQVMLAAAETDVAFRVTLALRDKLVEAYQEVMRMQV